MIEIRPFDTDDKYPLSQIYLKCRQNTFDWMPTETFQLADFEKDTEGEAILVATQNSQQIGFISIWTQDHFIHHLFVDPNHQGKGVGKLLLIEALKKIRRPARLKCLVKNAKACRFYEMNGWAIESTTADDPLGPYHTYVLFT